MAITKLDNITDLNLEAYLNTYSQASDADLIRQLQLNTVNTTLNLAIDQINGSSLANAYSATASGIKVATATLTAAEIVGTTAGTIGHADGAELVAAPGSGYVLQFVSAVLIYDYDTAAYTGGAGDDLTVYINSVVVSPAIATTDLITKAGDTVISLSALSANDYILGVNSNINLAATEITQPGAAAGVIRCIVSYRTITTGL